MTILIFINRLVYLLDAINTLSACQKLNSFIVFNYTILIFEKSNFCQKLLKSIYVSSLESF